MTEQPSPYNLGYTGPLDVASRSSSFNAAAFLVRQILGKAWTVTIVQVKKATNNGGLSPVGFVDVQPLVNQIDGYGQAVPHGTIYHIPYFRLQGGTSAIIIDPAVDDIGIMVVASRDISSVVANKAQANPGSFRQFDPSDGIYIGGILNGIPQQYLRFFEGNIEAVATSKITLKAPLVEIDGSITATGEITAKVGTADSVTMTQHVHTANNTPPTPGT